MSDTLKLNPTIMTPEKKLQELDEKFKNYNWHYRRSEMRSKIEEGRAKWHEIQKRMNELNDLGYEKEVEELYLKHRPF